MVFASEVSAITGDNQYQPILETFEKIWVRNRPQQYHAAVGRAREESGRPIATDRREAMEQLVLETEVKRGRGKRVLQ